jgi:hypothetical protein
MDCKLSRLHYLNTGILSTLDVGGVRFSTLEHAFLSPVDTYLPIIPQGNYVCVRGTHCLHNGIPFETFEITGLDGHTGLLFHPGNYNQDSSGCVLVGQDMEIGSIAMVTNSKASFAKFMSLQEGCDRFTITVS